MTATTQPPPPGESQSDSSRVSSDCPRHSPGCTALRSSLPNMSLRLPSSLTSPSSGWNTVELYKWLESNCRVEQPDIALDDGFDEEEEVIVRERNAEADKENVAEEEGMEAQDADGTDVPKKVGPSYRIINSYLFFCKIEK